MNAPLRILVLTFYYRPDLSAGSFRATALVNALREQLPRGSHLDVITTRPNRYSSYTAEADEAETEDGLRIERLPLPTHSSDMAGQAKSFLSFARAAVRISGARRYDLVFATSSRLMTAALGAHIARRTRARLYLDIRDIFVDTMADILPRMFAAPMARVLGFVERRTMQRAQAINLVSRGFEDYFRRRYPRARLSWFTNGIDDEFLVAAPSALVPSAGDRPLRVLYAGNIGEGQGLHLIIPQLAQRAPGMHFVVIGDGGRRAALKDALAAAGVTNVELLPPVPRAGLIAEYQKADALFLHLNAHRAFEKVLPSKIFEYAAMGKPIWAGVAGYAARFLREQVPNSAVFTPCDAQDALRVFAALSLEANTREEFITRFKRINIAREMAADILAVARDPDRAS